MWQQYTYIPTEAKGERRQFLQKQDASEGRGFPVKDKIGMYIEKPDMVSKYERRKLVGNNDDYEGDDIMNHLCYSQFAKMFQHRGRKSIEKEDDNGDVDREEGDLNEEDNYNYVMTGVNDGEEEPSRMKLPNLLTLCDPYPGEPSLLHKRTFPRALRFFKKNFDVNAHKFFLAELMMYFPFRNENELFPDDEDKCRELYLKNQQKIEQVKVQVMPYLKSVEEAHFYYMEGQNSENADLKEEIGPLLDPEKEQEILDVEVGDEEEEHPHYLHIDPDQIEEQPEGEVNAKEKVFRTINIPSQLEILHPRAAYLSPL